MARGDVLIPAQRARREGGFTLIELLVTVVVTVVGLIGLFGVFTVTSRGNSESRESGEALSILESTAEEIRATTLTDFIRLYNLIGNDSTTWNNNPMPYHGGDTPGKTGVRFQRCVATTWLGDDLIRMEVYVRWGVEGALPPANCTTDPREYHRQLHVELVRSQWEAQR
jgi:type II secretory pathway pseudopilin PulG